MSDIWISMREKKLTNTLTLMTDTLTRVTAERDALQENYTLLGEVCDQMIGGAVNMLDIARDADRLAAENERLREALRFYGNPTVYEADGVGRHMDITFVASAALGEKS